MSDEACVVIDAGPLIHLDELECLDLIEGMGVVHISDLVWREATGHRPLMKIEMIANGQIAGAPVPVDATLSSIAKAFDLDAGEISALALLRLKRGRLFLCDDAAARMAGEAMGFQARGTIGLVVRAIRRGSRSAAEVRALIESIPLRTTLHVARPLLKEVLSQLPPP